MIATALAVCMMFASAGRAEDFYTDLRIEQDGTKLYLFDGPDMIKSSEVARLLGDTETLAAQKLVRQRRYASLSVGSAAMLLGSGGWGLSRYIRNYTAKDIPAPSTASLEAFSICSMVSGGVFLAKSSGHKRHLQRLNGWYTLEETEAFISDYNARYGLPRESGGVSFPWTLGEDGRVFDGNADIVDAEVFSMFLGDASRTKWIRRTQGLLTVSSVPLYLTGVLMSVEGLLSTDRGFSEAALPGLGGLGVLAGTTTALWFGRRKLKSLGIWYTTEEIQDGVDRYNRGELSTQAPSIRPEPQLLVSVGIAPGGIGVSVVF